MKYTWQRATVKAGMQERGTEIRRKCAGNKMNVHAHIVKVHMCAPPGKKMAM